MAAPRATRESSPTLIRDAIRADRYLSTCYREAYGALLAMASTAPHAGLPIVEVGGAPGMVKDVDPSVIVTDVIEDPTVDITCTAESLPFPDGGVRALIMKDVLHHVRDVRQYMAEATRVLAPGGCIACIEPYWGPLAGQVFRRFHPEPFEPDATEWGVSSDERWDSNQALAWILLRRDREQFLHEFPGWRIEEHGTLLGPSYMLAGGVFSRTRVPAGLLLGLHAAERRAARWLRPVHLNVAFALWSPTAGPA